MFKRFACVIFIRFVIASARPPSLCGYGQYRVKGEGTCRQCPVCLVGYGINECRSDIIYDPQKQPHCLPCIEGETFSSYNGSGPCDPCAPIDYNQRVVVKCTRYRDRRTECKHGYFEDKGHHQCSQQCCYCVGKTKLVAKCARDNVTEGRFCEPTRWDGQCDLKPLVTLIPTPTPVATVSKTSKHRTTVKSSPSTTHTIISANTTSTPPRTSPSAPAPTKAVSSVPVSLPTTTGPPTAGPTASWPTAPAPSGKSNPTVFPGKGTTSPSTVPPKGDVTRIHISLMIVAAAIVCLMVVIFIYCIYTRHYSGRGEMTPESKEQIHELLGSRVNYPIYQRVVNLSGVSSPASSARSSTMLQGTGMSSATGSQDFLLTSRCVPDIQVVRPNLSIKPSEYAVCGRKLSTLRYTQRCTLGRMLDMKGEKMKNNWRDIGMHLARSKEALKLLVDRCHECYYGGGIATMELFNNLSLTKPDLTVLKFMEISTMLGRLDVVSYLSDVNCLKFEDIPQERKEHIATLLERRMQDGHNWMSYACKLGFSCNEIEYFKLKKLVPQKYSPTLELIMVLNAHWPELTIEEFQEAAAVMGRDDVSKYLDRVIQDHNYETFEP